MSVNEEILQASSDSFWEVGKYERTVKRITDGHKLCNELLSLIRERSEIETMYAKKLRSWSQKWDSVISKGPEYGTTEAGWKGCLEEANRVADVHEKVGEDLVSSVSPEISSWKKENFHKSMMSFKEVKQMEDEFKKVQKPWAKRLSKVEKAKKEFHGACRAEKTTQIQSQNAQNDRSVSEDQKNKLLDKYNNCQKTTQTTRDKYEATLQDINAYNAKYMEDMTEVFNKCQLMEEKRLHFFKDSLFKIHKSLDISSNPSFGQIHPNLHSTINNADARKDLKWWSNNHGVDMPMNWPSFEEYAPDVSAMGSKKKAKEVTSATEGGITLTYVSHQKTDSYTSNNSDPANAPPPASVTEPEHHTDVPVSNGTDSGNPFGSDPELNKPNDNWNEDDTVDGPGGDEPKGVPVRALFDYGGAEDDELTFKEGDVFIHLKDEDEQGWCEGRVNGKTGFYPANYIEYL